MKKVTFLVVMLAFLANVAMAQNKERVNAYNYNKNARAYIQTAEQLMVQNRTDKAAKEMKSRLELAKESDIPMTNYGVAIAHTKGILKRSLEIFPDCLKILE